MSSAPSNQSQLDALRQYSEIHCDTLDVQVPEAFGPFIDCTSNQIIAFFEAVKQPQVVSEAAKLAKELEADEGKRVATGVKIIMVLLALRILPQLTGSVLTQSSMHTAHSTSGTVADVLQLISIYAILSPNTPTSRICIKVPSTWEGLQAAKILREEHGVRTLGTTLFSLEQAVVAHKVGCVAISPYVNEIIAHFEEGYVDRNKGFGIVRGIWEYFKREDVKSQTKIIPASLVSSAEVLSLAGIDGITIPPNLLKLLSETPVASSPFTASYTPDTHTGAIRLTDEEISKLATDEETFKKALGPDTEGGRKMTEAIEWFAKFEDKLEELVKKEFETSA